MWLVDVSIRRPVFATMMIGSLVIMGMVSFRGLAVDLFPKIEFPYVSVQTTMPGAAPSSIETEVTDKIEEAVNSISGIRQLRSISADGLSQVNIEFEMEENADVKAQEVRDKISGILADLPADADAPIVERLDPDAAPVVSVMISGDQPVAELTTFADEVVKERLQRMPGVGSVTLVGGRDREMRVWLDPSKLKSAGLSAPDVVRAVRNENAQLPGGRIETEGREREFGARALAEARTAGEFGAMMLAHRGNGRSTRLGDIARVDDGVADERSYAQLNGVAGVALEVRRQSGRNTIEVAKAVMAEVEILAKQAPPGVRLIVARDISRFVESSINDVLFDLALAIVLVIGITFLFLLSWRATIIVALDPGDILHIRHCRFHHQPHDHAGSYRGGRASGRRCDCRGRSGRARHRGGHTSEGSGSLSNTARRPGGARGHLRDSGRVCTYRGHGGDRGPVPLSIRPYHRLLRFGFATRRAHAHADVGFPLHASGASRTRLACTDRSLPPGHGGSLFHTRALVRHPRPPSHGHGCGEPCRRRPLCHHGPLDIPR